MFWSKKKVEPRDVACKTCGCMVLKSKAFKVIHDSEGGGYMMSFDAETGWTSWAPDYYCSRCKPAYEEVRRGYAGERHYYRTIEVAADGQEIKKS